MNKTTKAINGLLKKGGYKITPGRVEILRLLKEQKQPMAISQIERKMTKKVDHATVYRALEALCDSGFVSKVNLQNNLTNYELIENKNHHHHLVCETCGAIEDIKNCNTKNVEQVIIKKSNRFSSIKFHSLEFFGICNSCTK